MKTENIAVNIIKKAIVTITLIVVVILIVRGAKKAYDFGHAIFMDESVTSEEDSRDVTITIANGDSALDIGKMLERRGLIDNAYVFVAQSYCYEAGRKMTAGEYDLTTDMNAKEIMNAIVTQSKEQSEGGE